MKKAALYARVSSELQQKERTIESQIAELKKQVVDTGDVLVKEYIDDGYSGAQLDRPALDQLRRDLKTNLFDTIYFLNTDRIARDVAYQNIIIAEILKYKKQIIINGKDYIHNPENKFTLTVLGAVAELERAKIIERSVRGKMHRLKQGLMLGNGYNIYGYTYTPRSHISAASLTINEQQAEIVQYIFETYERGEIGVNQITRCLEERGILTSTGRKLWTVDGIKRMLKNETYAGTKYFNTRTWSKEQTNPIRAIKYGKRIFKDRSEWIGIKVPAIVSKNLFDNVQNRLERNKNRYRNPKKKYLLSNLIRCGGCGAAFYSYQRYYKKRLTNGDLRIYHKVAYMCSWRLVARMHSRDIIEQCHNPEIKAEFLEECVFKMIQDIMLDSRKLSSCMEFFKEKTTIDQFAIEKQMKDSDHEISSIEKHKKHVVDLYASGTISRDEYVEKNLAFDKEVGDLKTKKADLIKHIPLLHKTEVVDISIKHYCESAKARFERCTDFETKRQFLREHIEKIVFLRDNVTLRGSVPIKLNAYEDPDQSNEGSKIEFSIEGKIDRTKACLE